jgi:hypothetical protein
MDYVLQCALAKDYAPLIFQLRSTMELTPELREFLASHLEGKRQGKGRGASPRRSWEARSHFRLFFWLTVVLGNQRDHAYDQLAEAHGISRRSAIDFIKLAEENGLAELVVQEEKSTASMLEIETSPENYAVIEGYFRKRKEEILAGTYQEL